jgi:hypothetical protein
MFSNISKTLTAPIERLGSPLSLVTKSSTNTSPTSKSPKSNADAWYTAFPEPRHKAAHLPDVEKEDVLALLREGKKPGAAGDGSGFLLVDVRRDDCVGGVIRGSLNLPAQSFWYMRETLLGICRGSGVKEVAFYCGMFLSPFISVSCYLVSFSLSHGCLEWLLIYWGSDRLKQWTWPALCRLVRGLSC